MLIQKKAQMLNAQTKFLQETIYSIQWMAFQKKIDRRKDLFTLTKN